MRKITSIFLAILLFLTVTGCDNINDESTNDKNSSENTTANTLAETNYLGNINPTNILKDANIIVHSTPWQLSDSYMQFVILYPQNLDKIFSDLLVDSPQWMGIISVGEVNKNEKINCETIYFLKKALEYYEMDVTGKSAYSIKSELKIIETINSINEFGNYEKDDLIIAKEDYYYDEENNIFYHSYFKIPLIPGYEYIVTLYKNNDGNIFLNHAFPLINYSEIPEYERLLEKMSAPNDNVTHIYSGWYTLYDEVMEKYGK